MNPITLAYQLIFLDAASQPAIHQALSEMSTSQISAIIAKRSAIIAIIKKLIVERLLIVEQVMGLGFRIERGFIGFEVRRRVIKSFENYYTAPIDSESRMQEVSGKVCLGARILEGFIGFEYNYNKSVLGHNFYTFPRNFELCWTDGGIKEVSRKVDCLGAKIVEGFIGFYPGELRGPSPYSFYDFQKSDSDSDNFKNLDAKLSAFFKRIFLSER